MVNRIHRCGLELKLGCPAVSRDASEALWQLPFHLGSPMFNWPHYVINLVNLPLTLKAQLWALADHKPTPKVTQSLKPQCQHLGQSSDSTGKFSLSNRGARLPILTTAPLTQHMTYKLQYFMVGWLMIHHCFLTNAQYAYCVAYYTLYANTVQFYMGDILSWSLVYHLSSSDLPSLGQGTSEGLLWYLALDPLGLVSQGGLYSAQPPSHSINAWFWMGFVEFCGQLRLWFMFLESFLNGICSCVMFWGWYVANTTSHECQDPKVSHHDIAF